MSPSAFRQLPLKRSWFERSTETGRLFLHEERHDEVNGVTLHCAFRLLPNGRRDTS